MRVRRCCVRSLVRPVPVSAREAVLTETRAACATSLSVTLIKPADRLQTIAETLWANSTRIKPEKWMMVLNAEPVAQSIAGTLRIFRRVSPFPEFNRSPGSSLMKMFRGTYTVMITPFTPTGDIDVAALRAFVDWQIAEGI